MSAARDEPGWCRATLVFTIATSCGAQPVPATTTGTAVATAVDIPVPPSADPTSAPPLARQAVPAAPAEDPDLNPDKPHCRPLPEVGSACARGQSYCVVDWGSPGGHSTALWCRDGTWHRIEEQNLD